MFIYLLSSTNVYLKQNYNLTIVIPECIQINTKLKQQIFLTLYTKSKQMFWTTPNQKSQEFKENCLRYFAHIYESNLFVDTVFHFPY